MLVLHVPIMQCNLVLGDVLLHLLHAPLHHGDQLALLHQAAPLPDLVLGSHLNTEQGLGPTLQLEINKSNPTHFLVLSQMSQQLLTTPEVPTLAGKVFILWKFSRGAR